MNKSRFKQLQISMELLLSFIKFSLAKKYPIKGKDVSAGQVAEWVATVKESGFIERFSEETFINTLHQIIENSDNPISLQIRIPKNDRQLDRLYWLLNKKKHTEGIKNETPKLYDSLLNQQKYVDSQEGKNIDKYI